MIKFKAEVTGMGEFACDFLNDICNFIVIFNDDAPAELAEICVLHEKTELKADPCAGDTCIICGHEYKISAVGWEALNTLRELGHCTISFNGHDEAERPGMIELVGERITEEELRNGGYIEIFNEK